MEEQMKRPLKALIAAILPATLAFSALMSACTDSHTHTLTPVAAKEATCTEAGNIAYWFCDDCDKYFSDAEAENEITQAQTVISALGHKWSALWTGGAQGHWHECDVCHEADSVVAHADANTDGVCDVCGYTISAEEPDTEDPIAVEGITLDKTTATVEEGATVTLTATVTPDNATDKTVTWSTSDETIATVSGGVVTGVKAGEVTITAKAGDKSATCTVTVTAASTEPEVVPVTGVTLSQTAVTLDIDQSITLTATVAPENATNKAVTWASDKTDVATVDANGKVTAVAAGTANITVTTADGGKTATCAVTVNPATEPEDPTITYEDVTTKLDYETGYALYPSNSTETIVLGRFTIEAGARFDSSTGGLEGKVLNNQQKKVSFSLQGTQNSITFDMKGASDSGTDMTLYKADGTVVYAWNHIAKNEVVLGCKVENLTAGDYYLDSVGSARIANLAITERLAASDPAGIEVSGGQTEFLVGDEFVSTGLNVTLVYENGRRESLTAASYKLDSSKYIAGTSGTYTITVSYTPAGASAAFTDTYDVDVYAIDSLKVYDFVLGSGRVTQNLQKVFLKDSQFNYDNLAIQAVGKLDGSDKTHTFYLTDSDYTVTLDGDTSTVGEKTVNISVNSERGTATASYKINVVENVFTQPKGTYTVNVNAAGTVAVSIDNVTFTGINDALKYFEITGVPAASAKVINVAAGNYNEKVEVNIPNVSIIGAGAESTVLWYDALNGALDPGGSTTYSTDGSATISIRESATGFYAENITFKNYWNTQELYEQSKLIAGSGTQAVAALVQADMAKFVNVHFTSYQDTLYAQVGRQYYENCYIEGRTDYVFGYNATAYFTNTELHTILGDSEKNGGYVVSTKGLADGIDKDGIEYGYIFNDCTFTADEGVTAGTVSLARGWDKNMRVVIMNSDISGAYSKEAYGDTSSEKNDRYGKMNAEPVAANLIEAGNTGDGAITASLENTCTVITVEEAAKYSDFATIFGTTNGKVTYAEAWVPVTEGDTVAVTDVSIVRADDTAITDGKIALKVNDAATGKVDLDAVITPENATNVNVVWYSSKEEVATVDESGVVTALSAGETVVAVVTVDGDKIATVTITVEAGALLSEEFNVDDLEIGYKPSAKPTAPVTIEDNNLYTVQLSGDGSATVTANFSQATANDGSGRVYVNGLLPGGGGRSITISAKLNCSITLYYTSCNGDFGKDDQSKGGNLQWTINDGAQQTSTTTGNKSSNIAYTETIELNAGDVVVFTVSSNRLVLFGVYGIQV